MPFDLMVFDRVIFFTPLGLVASMRSFRTFHPFHCSPSLIFGTKSLPQLFKASAKDWVCWSNKTSNGAQNGPTTSILLAKTWPNLPSKKWFARFACDFFFWVLGCSLGKQESNHLQSSFGTTSTDKIWRRELKFDMSYFWDVPLLLTRFALLASQLSQSGFELQGTSLLHVFSFSQLQATSPSACLFPSEAAMWMAVRRS